MNCPVPPLEALPNVLFAPNVTFATGLVEASQVIVEASVNVSSVKVAPPETVKVVLTVAAPVTPKVEPSKVKFASPLSPDPVPVTTRLLLSFAYVGASI